MKKIEHIKFVCNQRYFRPKVHYQLLEIGYKKEIFVLRDNGSFGEYSPIIPVSAVKPDIIVYKRKSLLSRLIHGIFR